MPKFRLLQEDILLEVINEDKTWIQKQARENSVQIKIKKKPPKGMRERVVEVYGSTSKTAKKGVIEVCRKLAEVNEDGSEVFSRKFCTDEVQCCLLVQKDVTGAVIGEKGIRIKDVLKKYEIQCDIERQCIGQSDEKTVRVTGPTEQVISALEKILANILEHGRNLTPRYPYDPFYGGPGAVAPPSFRRQGVHDDWSLGDWFCPACHYKNFGKNSRCKKCGGPKPKYDLDRGVSYKEKQMYGPGGYNGYMGYGRDRGSKDKNPYGASYAYSGSAGAYSGYMGSYGGGRKGQGKYEDKYGGYGTSYKGW